MGSSAIAWVRGWLRHPLTRGLSLDDPRATVLRREILRSKPFLRQIYLEWYQLILDSLPAAPGAVVEVGSGAGFLQEILPEVIASERFAIPGVRVVADGRRLPFRGNVLRGIAMVDVLHHIHDCRRFFDEAARCVRPGGVLVAIEPWVSLWSRFVYGRLHHEPFEPDAVEWEFPATGPLSGANQALPWIVFARDRARFEQDHPQWHVTRVRPFMPFRYLASGGVGLRGLAPNWSYPLIATLDRLAEPWMENLAMFAHIELRRTTKPVAAPCV